DICADAESAAVERGVPLDLVALTMPAESHDRVPHARLARKGRQGTQRDVVVDRDTAYPSCYIQIGRHSAPEFAGPVDQIQIHGERRPLRPVAAQARPQTVAFNSPDTVGRSDAGKKGSVEMALHDLTCSACVAAERRDIHVNVNAERNPRED